MNSNPKDKKPKKIKEKRIKINLPTDIINCVTSSDSFFESCVTEMRESFGKKNPFIAVTNV